MVSKASIWVNVLSGHGRVTGRNDQGYRSSNDRLTTFVFAAWYIGYRCYWVFLIRARLWSILQHAQRCKWSSIESASIASLTFLLITLVTLFATASAFRKPKHFFELGAWSFFVSGIFTSSVQRKHFWHTVLLLLVRDFHSTSNCQTCMWDRD